jgi:dephospho-CoA kinase/inosine/xanthosine triphosphate pyrophosphatase family protein
MNNFDLFRKSKIKLNLFFVTSNLVKSYHINHLCNLFGIPVKYYKKIFQSYQENYNFLPEEAIKFSVNFIAQKLKHLGLFFIEDSSIKIDALSENNREYPGLETKEFFTNKSFSDIDRLIKAKGNNRNATIISRIGLHLPGNIKPEVFYGEIKGKIVEIEPKINKSNKNAIWLYDKSPINFFIPNGENDVLSNLKVKDSYEYDVRLRALEKMFYRLFQFVTIIENAKSIYIKIKPDNVYQLPLFIPKVIIISGYTGAGKTTSATYFKNKHGYYFLEESDVIKKEAFISNFRESNLSNFVNEKVKSNDPLYFIKLLIQNNKVNSNKIVISGVRNPKEIEYLKEIFLNSKLIYIDAPLELRYLRTKVNGRFFGKYNKLCRITKQEKLWGMEKIKKKSDFVIRNIGNIEYLLLQLDRVISK